MRSSLKNIVLMLALLEVSHAKAQQPSIPAPPVPVAGPASLAVLDEVCLAEEAGKVLNDLIATVKDKTASFAPATYRFSDGGNNFADSTLPPFCNAWQLIESTSQNVRVCNSLTDTCPAENSREIKLSRIRCSYNESLARAHFSPGALAMVRANAPQRCRREIRTVEQFAEDIEGMRSILLRIEQRNLGVAARLPPRDADRRSN